MKKIISKYAIAAVVVAGVLSGCGKDFLDINTNPNSPTSASPNLILSAGLNRTAAQQSTSLNILGSLWSGQMANATDMLWFNSEKQYNITSSFYTGIWETGYDILNDFEVMQKNAEALNQQYYIGIAKIMKAHGFQIIVDAYGNLPFSEALKGTNVLRPKYDNAEEIYQQLIVMLDEGIAAIKNAPATEAKPSTDDILFKGDMTKWVKFANTLKLRILIRQSEIASKASYIAAEIAKIEAEGSGYLGAGQSAEVNPGYLSTSSKLNPYWESYHRNAAGSETQNYRAVRPTLFLFAQYDAYNDPRKTANYEMPVDTNIYNGVALGEATGGPDVNKYKYGKTSAIKAGGAILRTATAATPILTAEESLFLQAEAAERGWISANASTLYEEAISESFKRAGVIADFATYIAQPAVDYATATDKIEAIIVQKWFALNMIGSWETWNDFRRTKFPSDNPLSKAALAQKHPARLLYPNSELGRNEANVLAQGTINAFDTKLFWDKK